MKYMKHYISQLADNISYCYSHFKKSDIFVTSIMLHSTQYFSDPSYFQILQTAVLENIHINEQL